MKLAGFDPVCLVVGCCMQSELLNSAGSECISETYKVYHSHLVGGCFLQFELLNSIG